MFPSRRANAEYASLRDDIAFLNADVVHTIYISYWVFLDTGFMHSSLLVEPISLTTTVCLNTWLHWIDWQ